MESSPQPALFSSLVSLLMDESHEPSPPERSTLDRIEVALARLESRIEVLEALALEKSKRTATTFWPAKPGPLQPATTPELDAPRKPTADRPAASSEPQPVAVADSPSSTDRPRVPREAGLEQLIGGRWFTWLGAASLALAVAFFVPWAWTHFQLPPAVRVAIFHLVGLGLLGGAYVLGRRKLTDLAHGIAGLGVFVLYASAYAMEHHYHLFAPHSNLVALLDCALITASAVYAAVRFDSAYIVLLGALGGYLIPLVPPRVTDDFSATFAYLAFLNVALLAAATLRPWQFLKPAAVAATAVMFLFWISDNDPGATWRYEWMLILHAAIFLVGTNGPPLLGKRTSNSFDLAAVAGNSLWFVGGTWTLFHDRTAQQMAMVCWAMSALHAALFGWTYHRLTNADRLPRVHLALAVMFFTLAVPLQMNDVLDYLAYAWSVEAFVFTAIGVYFRDRQMTASGTIVFALAALRAVMFDFTGPAELVGSSAVDRRLLVMLSVGLAGIATGSCYWWVAKMTGDVAEPNDRREGAVLMGLGNVLLLLGCLCQWHDRTVLVLWTLNAALLWCAAQHVRTPGMSVYALVISVLFVGGRAVYHHAALEGPFTLIANPRFESLLLVAALYLVAGWFQLRQRRSEAAGVTASIRSLPPRSAGEGLGEGNLRMSEALHLLGHAALFAAVTFEIHNVWQPNGDLLTLVTGGKSREEHVAYSVAWAIYAAALVAFGFVVRYRLPRLLGLAGLLAVAVKVFFVDLASLPLILRVLSLAALGALLLVTSFWYQKYTARIEGDVD